MTYIAIKKRPASEGWHPAFIVYQLRLRGLSLRRLARLNGYAESSGLCAIQRPFPKIERLIAGAIGVEPQTIWPSRYNPDGTHKTERRKKGSTPRAARNDHAEGRK